MAERARVRRKFGRFEYDPVTGTYILGAVVLAAVVLGAMAFSYQGSPRMDDRAAVEQGVTIPHPTQLSPAPSTGSATPR
jgi:hypothetical protein